MKYLKTYEASKAMSEILGEMLINRIIENNTDAAIKLINDKNIDINYKDKDGYSPILAAAIKERTLIVKLLIEKGANVNDQDYRGQTPLMCVSNYTWEKLELLETTEFGLLKKPAILLKRQFIYPHITHWSIVILMIFFYS